MLVASTCCWFLRGQPKRATRELCGRRSFTEVSDQVPARSRLTKRLRSKVSASVTATNRVMSEVAGNYGVAWWTVHRILVATAVQALGEAAPTVMIGIDETRARSVRWFFKETGWRRSDPWMTFTSASSNLCPNSTRTAHLPTCSKTPIHVFRQLRFRQRG